jgi:hypothetical protein
MRLRHQADRIRGPDSSFPVAPTYAGQHCHGVGRLCDSRKRVVAEYKFRCLSQSAGLHGEFVSRPGSVFVDNRLPATSQFACMVPLDGSGL